MAMAAAMVPVHLMKQPMIPMPKSHVWHWALLLVGRGVAAVSEATLPLFETGLGGSPGKMNPG